MRKFLTCLQIWGLLSSFLTFRASFALFCVVRRQGVFLHGCSVRRTLSSNTHQFCWIISIRASTFWSFSSVSGLCLFPTISYLGPAFTKRCFKYLRLLSLRTWINCPVMRNHLFHYFWPVTRSLSYPRTLNFGIRNLLSAVTHRINRIRKVLIRMH